MPLPYRIAVTGSRTLPDTLGNRERIGNTLEAWYRSGAELFVGDATGADEMAADAWMNDVAGTPATVLTARFQDQGLKGYAGNIRNDLIISRMPDILLAFVHNPYDSPGTMDCIARAREAGIFTVVAYWPKVD